MDGAIAVRGRALSATLALVLAAAAGAAAQGNQAAVSLGEVARQAEAAKSSIRKAKKSYTNADLGAEAQREKTETASAPTTGLISAPGKPVTAEEVVASTENKVDEANRAAQNEERWRQRAESIRIQIAKLQTRLTSLLKPNEARSANPAAQARQDAEIANVRTGLAGLERQWASLEDAARETRIPSDWLDPRPSRQ